MKKIILIRHAKSDSKHPYSSDFERPLNERGKKDAPIMAKLLKELYPDIQLFLSSPAVRAKHTAVFFAEQFGIEQNKIHFNKNLYLASPHDILFTLSTLDNSLNSVAVVAHNPGITDLASHLGRKFISNMPTSSFAALSINASSWHSIELSPGTLENFHFPKEPK